jgi:hypothetical protein
MTTKPRECRGNTCTLRHEVHHMRPCSVFPRNILDPFTTSYPPTAPSTSPRNVTKDPDALCRTTTRKPWHHYIKMEYCAEGWIGQGVQNVMCRPVDLLEGHNKTTTHPSSVHWQIFELAFCLRNWENLVSLKQPQNKVTFVKCRDEFEFMSQSGTFWVLLHLKRRKYSSVLRILLQWEARHIRWTGYVAGYVFHKCNFRW